MWWWQALKHLMFLVVKAQPYFFELTPVKHIWVAVTVLLGSNYHYRQMWNTELKGERLVEMKYRQ